MSRWLVAYGQILPSLFSTRLAWLPQPSCLPVAALARRGADRPRHHGRRYGDGCDGDAHGSRSRYRAGRHGESIAIGPDMTAGELSDRLARLGADLMVARSRRPVARRSRHRGAVGRGRHLRQQRSKSPRRRSTGPAPPPKSTTTSAVCRQIPAPGSRPNFGKGEERVKVLRSTMADGKGAPGSVLDANLTVACGSGAVRLVELQRGGKQPTKAADFLRGLRSPLASLG